MLDGLIARRAMLAQRHDEARNRWPTLRDASFGREVSAIAKELAAIAEEMQRLPDAPAEEKARSWMWLGDAFFDLAQGGHASYGADLDAYRRAETFLRASNDRVLKAKLDGNLGNILLKSTETDVERLKEAVRRYESALPVIAQLDGAKAAQLAKCKQVAESRLTMLAEFYRELDEAKEVEQRIATMIERGGLPRGRAEALRLQIDKLLKLPRRPETPGEMLSVLKQAKEALEALKTAAAGGLEGGDPHHRSTWLRGLVLDLWRQLFVDVLRIETPAPARQQMYDHTTNLVRLEQDLAKAAGDRARAVEIETTTLRTTARDARATLGRDRLSWIEPLIPFGRTSPDPNGVYFTGSRQRGLVHEVCASHGLNLLRIEPGAEIGEAHFDAIRRANVVVADLTEQSDLAAVCYDVGLALVLGRPLVVLTPRGVLPPFDIDLVPTELHLDGNDAKRVGMEIDRALLLPQRKEPRGGEDVLLARARRRFPDQPVLLNQIERAKEDRRQVEAILETLVGERGLVVRTTWPTAATDDEPRLFHVMPYDPPWAPVVKQRVAEACKGKARYVRQDDVRAARVVASLFGELCRSTHVVVDLTGFSANVTLELAIAQALGKELLVLGQKGTSKGLFSSVSRLQVDEYAVEDQRLEAAVEGFLARRG